jgi:uncharacterized PurR-regulated membrane protein YhhQ (DUF165 family)
MPVQQTGKPLKLFLILASCFLTNALIAEFIGVKIFSLEKSLGLQPLHLDILGIEGLSFNLTAGVILWPFVFILTDIINEYYGVKGVRFISYLAAGLIAYAFIMVRWTMHLTPADFWPLSHLQNPGLDAAKKLVLQQDVGNYSTAYNLVFGQGLWIIIGSLVAFLLGQIIDVFVFHKIKGWTGESRLWFRSTGSTLISQCIDSFVVLFIAFHIGAGWSIQQVFAIGIVNYLYKFCVALCMTPAIYLVHSMIEKYLGTDMATKMKQDAMLSS